MKSSRLFLITFVALVVIAVLLFSSGRRHYEWNNPSFGHHDDEPFGCQLFDRLMAASMEPGHYDTRSVTIHKWIADSAKAPQGWLIVDYNCYFFFDEARMLMEMARRGHRIMVVSNSVGRALTQHVGIRVSDYAWNPKELASAVGSDSHRSVVWTEHPTVYPPDSYLLPSYFVNSEVKCDTAAAEELVHVDDGNWTMAARLPVGDKGGCIILVSAPLLFTNYGVLKTEGRNLVFRLMTQLGSLPVTRLQLSERRSSDEEPGLLSYIDRQPALHLAKWLTLIAVLLFMLTMAQRRQRVIPVMQTPKNHSLEFVRLIGTLYRQRGEHADLVVKKFYYTAERLRHELHVDITDAQQDSHSVPIIARGCGVQADEVQALLTNVRLLIDSGATLSSQQMCRYIDQLDGLLKMAESPHTHEKTNR